MYANIQKFIQFQCTVNGVALGLNFIAAVVNGEAPLTAVQVSLRLTGTKINLSLECMKLSLVLLTQLMHAAFVGKSYHGHHGSTCLGN